MTPPSAGRSGSSVASSRITSAVRCTTRITPVSPTNIWCASSVSMKRQVRGQRVEARLGQGGKLILAVAVGEEGEHQVGQPVGRRLVEGPQDARPVGVAGVPLQHRLGLLAPVAPEVGVQQVDHGPQVPPLFHVYLEQVAQVVQRRAGKPQPPLLLHRPPVPCRPA